MELKRLAAIILLILLMLVPTYANSWQSVESDMTTPVALPSKQTLKLIGSCALTVDGQVVGGMAVYDDVATRISTDYAEIYNPTGDLLAIVWLDRLGILRILPASSYDLLLQRVAKIEAGDFFDRAAVMVL